MVLKNGDDPEFSGGRVIISANGNFPLGSCLLSRVADLDAIVIDAAQGSTVSGAVFGRRAMGQKVVGPCWQSCRPEKNCQQTGVPPSNLTLAVVFCRFYIVGPSSGEKNTFIP